MRIGEMKELKIRFEKKVVPVTETEIAVDYSVTKEAIAAIKSGRNWKHLNLQGAQT